MQFKCSVGKYIGLKRALEKECGMDIVVPEKPQIMGAIGTALLAAAA